MKKSKKFKIIIASLLLVSLSGNIFAAAVSDNDGSAFISKSEFDSLKANFQAQIDNYNTSIDGKIDAAIAAYLAGIKISAQSIKPIIFQDAAQYGVISIDSKNPLDYCYGIPRLQNDTSQTRFKPNESITSGGATTGLVMTRKWKQPTKPQPNTRSRHFATKSVITKLVQDETTKTNSIAQWEGYRKECDDLIKSLAVVRDTEWHTGTGTAQNGLTFTNAYCVMENIYPVTNKNVIGENLFVHRDKQISGTTYTSINMSTTEFFNSKSITHDWGTNVYPFVTVLQNYNYDMFSNKDRDYNYYYTGTYKRYFKPDTINETYDNQARYTWNPGGYTASGNLVGNPFRYGYNGNAEVKCAWYSISAWTCKYQTGSITIASNRLWNNNSSGAKTLQYRVPMIGFETTYLQSWKQIYLAGTEGIATFEKAKKLTAANSILTSPKNSSNVYLGLTAGFPIIKLDKYEKLKFDAIFKDTKKDYVVWVSNKPFSSTGHPDDDTNCLELKGLTKASNTSRGYLVKNGSGTFETPKYKDAGYVYLKWGIYNDTKANIGGGVLQPTGYATVIHEPD